ncbi:MAG: DMT family transporter [Kiritimatiellae bacterium]|nr:DMT family transporter [Kiritimatiellia bacterium]
MTTGLAAAVCVILFWGVTFASTRVLLEDFSALEIQLIRFGLAWLVLRLADRRIASRFRSWRDEALFASMGLTGVALYQLLENCAIYYTNASNVAILVSFGPVVTAVLSRLLTGDKSLSPRFALGALTSVAGVALVSLNGVMNFQMRPLGDMMALGAMISWGVYSVLIDMANRRGIPQMEAVRRAFFWSLVMIAPLSVWGVTKSGFYALDGSFSVTIDIAENIERFTRPLNLINLAFLGILASAACFVMWNRACKVLGVVRTTIGLYLTPIVGVIFAALFLDEKPTAMSAVGGILIIAGVILATIRFAEKEKK